MHNQAKPSQAKHAAQDSTETQAREDSAGTSPSLLLEEDQPTQLACEVVELAPSAEAQWVRLVVSGAGSILAAADGERGTTTMLRQACACTRRNGMPRE
mmetsp:Transcript_9512/g.16673  ORF Transcript_9512/g.16673 Transcript_9512/m.16673 type:complete len:99 (-) Transcript_9512:2314-2610(-)|eukprot:CAMPEP_0171495004 /NCGR_PEP_ID=MMETSP0958-20121227/5880_1 /TAXON_ID=87120 /ORGANISM="Aurantiochytrium limacinum, Strain ATCCMYA-1381" /LENGTH=98 /DNA_ID=CAMNT_0012028897 /DNA_START=1641 /DNA_END=1937 /DNA_ORIENTATION=-